MLFCQHKVVMRIAIVQTNPEFGKKASNIEQALLLMSSAGADLYVLPELFASGYNFTGLPEVKSLAEEIPGPTSEAISGFCKRNASYVVYGFAEKTNRLFNSAAIMGPNGLIGVYRKVHLYYRETLFFSPGDLGFPVFDLPFGRIGIMVCFDWIYPESCRTLALKGAQLIAHPSNLVLPHCPDAMITRCIENRVFAATANRIGVEDRGGIRLTYIGSSEIVSHRGEIFRRLDRISAGVAVADVDLAGARDKQLNEYNDLLAGRRADQYSL